MCLKVKSIPFSSENVLWIRIMLGFHFREMFFFYCLYVHCLNFYGFWMNGKKANFWLTFWYLIFACLRCDLVSELKFCNLNGSWCYVVYGDYFFLFVDFGYDSCSNNNFISLLYQVFLKVISHYYDTRKFRNIFFPFWLLKLIFFFL